ncbi:MAG: FAD-dependent oxidoreductase [Candidatus Moraniibacteriota bacterium]
MDTKTDVIIIGGGISGLSAAHHLKKHNIDFKLISDDIGGRIHSSKNGNIQYGAYYVMDIYTHTKEFAKIGRKIKPSELIFHKRGKGYSILQKSFIKYIPQVIRFAIILRKFKKHYGKFKKDCCTISQAEAIRNNPYLTRIYETNAAKFIKENKISDVVCQYMEEILHGTTFTKVEKLNTFTFLQFSLPLITSIYEFVLDKNKITKDFKNHIIDDVVDSLKKEGDFYILKTPSETYKAKNIIVATPPHVSKKLLNLKEIKGAVDAHMFHIAGQVQEKWCKGFCNLFSDENDMLAIAFMPDYSCLFYSKNPKPDFSKYFYDFKILETKYWKPAFNLEGNVLWDSKIADNCYLIGDHNVCGIEDSFITGIYAANQIIAKKNQ